jgi:hypothetical protein
MSLPKPPANVRSADNSLGLEDFFAVPESNRFLYRPLRTFWPAESIDKILPGVRMPYKQNGKYVKLQPTVWLMRFRRVEQTTWAPGLPEIIADKLISEGGWRSRPGAHAYNLYLPPDIVLGDAAKATPWIEHLNKLYPEDAEDITNWFAHRVQCPGVKINHALVMGGAQGVGKDWLLKALKLAVGDSNYLVIFPPDLLAAYNPFAKTVVLHVNEAHDQGDNGRIDRYALYERTKIYAAAPPDVLPCVDKYIRRFYVPNVLGMVITTNHKTDGVYLPNDDRRHLVAWSECTKEEFSTEFWNNRFRWLVYEGGASHVAAYLAQRDLSAFNPGAVPRQTTAFFEIVSVNRAPEDDEIADALDELGEPGICSLLSLVATNRAAAMEWLLDRRRRRSIPYRLERCGYRAYRNPDRRDGLWIINDRRQTLYAKTTLTPEERETAARAFVAEYTKTVGNG